MNLESIVADIVLEHSECAAVLQAHRIDFCCNGHLSLEQACRAKGADPLEVLAELERAIDERVGPGDVDPRSISMPVLITFLLDTHHRHVRDALAFLVPLANKVARVHGMRHANLHEVRDTVMELSALLSPHLDLEERVFEAARRNEVLADELRHAKEEHVELGALLSRLRIEADDYRVPEDACGSYRTLYRELEALETNLHQQIHVENHALMPRLRA